MLCVQYRGHMTHCVCSTEATYVLCAVQRSHDVLGVQYRGHMTCCEVRVTAAHQILPGGAPQQSPFL